jgi:squalene-associated FAD-dependent desaturase
MTPDPVPPVIVVGGGVAGLSAATALAEAGVRTALFEARPSLGGRCSTFTDRATGERVDNGQHVLIGCYDETFRFLRRIGAMERVRVQADLSLRIVDIRGESSVLRCPSWPAPAHLLGGLLRWRALSWSDRLASLRMLPALRAASPAGWVPNREAEPQTVRAWLRAHGQTERLIELLWEPLAVAALNQSIDTAAAGPFREVVRRMFTRDRRDSTLVLPTVPLQELFVYPSLVFLEKAGSDVSAGSPARIDVCEGGNLVVHVRDSTLPAPAVVCAVPWHALSDVLPDRPDLRATRDDADATASSPIVTVNLWLDRDIISDEFVGLPGRQMQWIFDKRRLFGEAAAHLSLVSSGAEAIALRTNQELIDLAWGEVQQALPAAAQARVTRAVVVREKRATFSLAPGQPRRPSTATAIPGLFLAGDWIDTGLPATIESAVMSGHHAAAAVLKYLGSKREPWNQNREPRTQNLEP